MLKPPTPDLSRTHAIVNARSGKSGHDAFVADLTRRITAAGGTLSLHLDGRDGRIDRLTRRALDAGATTVVAAGGDGTLSGVAGVMAGRGVPLGIVPMGTFNYFARAMGIPTDPEGAIRTLTDGVLHPAAVGRINDAVFLNNTSIGVYAAILREREETYLRYGRSRLAAYWSVIRALSRVHDPLEMRITVDGEERRVKTPLAFVGASAYQLERFGLEGAQAVRAGALALFIAEDAGRLGLVRQAARLAARTMQAGRDVHLVTGREIVIDAGPRRRTVVRDGEKVPMHGPFRIRLDPGALDVIVPRAGA